MTPVQKTKTIFMIFLACLIGAGVLYFYQTRTGGKTPFHVTEEAEFTKIEVQSRDGDYTLENRGGKWWVSSPFEDWAEEKVVDGFLDAFQKMEIGPVISENPDRYDQFAISEEHARRIKVFIKNEEKPSMDAYFGKRATSGYGSTYFRRAGKKKVHIVSNFPVYLLARFPKDFRQVTLLPETPSGVSGITVGRGEVSQTLVRSSHSWLREGSEEAVNPSLMQNFFSRWPGIRSIGPGEGDSPDDPDVHIVLEGDDPLDMEVFLEGASDPGQVLVSVNGRPPLLASSKPLFLEWLKEWEKLQKS